MQTKGIKKFFSEFRNFAIKGNMMDMAVGVVIGTAFNKVISIIVKEIIMPPMSLLTDDVSLSDKKIILRHATDTSTELAIGYGDLFESLLDFFIIAFTIFLVIKGLNRFKKKAEDPEDLDVETPKNIELLSKIEKLLEEQNKLLKKE